MWVLYITLGVAAGIFGGLFGVGGGLVMVPLLVYLFGLSQHQAQGTSLAAMLPPIGLLAVLHYYYKGNVKVNIALWVCLGFFIGGWLGALLTDQISDPALKKIFGIMLLLVSIKMILGK